MQETAQDLDTLQRIIDESIDRAGAFLHSAFQMPDHSLNAKQLAHYLDGQIIVAFATITAKGAPRVAPIAALFYRGHFHIPTVMTAARTKMLRRNAAVSLTYYEGNDFAIILHGQSELIRMTDAAFASLEKLHRQFNQSSLTEWGGEGVFIRIVPHKLYTFARYPERFKVETS